MNDRQRLAQTGNLLRPVRPARGEARHRIPSVSPRRAEERAIYAKMLPGWLRAHPKCAIGPIFHAAGIMVKCKGRTTHPHHVKGRIGKLLYDERYLLPSCSGECHPKAVHRTHVKEARSLGLLV